MTFYTHLAIINVDFRAIWKLSKTAQTHFYNFQIESAHHTEELKAAIRRAGDLSGDRQRGRVVITANITAF